MDEVVTVGAAISEDVVAAMAETSVVVEVTAVDEEEEDSTEVTVDVVAVEVSAATVEAAIAEVAFEAIDAAAFAADEVVRGPQVFG